LTFAKGSGRIVRTAEVRGQVQMMQRLEVNQRSGMEVIELQLLLFT